MSLCPQSTICTTQIHFFIYILKQLCQDPSMVLLSYGKLRRKRLEGPTAAGLGAPPGIHCFLDFSGHQLVPLLVSATYLLTWPRSLSPLSPCLPQARDMHLSTHLHIWKGGPADRHRIDTLDYFSSHSRSPVGHWQGCWVRSFLLPSLSSQTHAFFPLGTWCHIKVFNSIYILHPGEWYPILTKRLRLCLRSASAEYSTSHSIALWGWQLLGGALCNTTSGFHMSQLPHLLCCEVCLLRCNVM